MLFNIYKENFRLHPYFLVLIFPLTSFFMLKFYILRCSAMQYIKKFIKLNLDFDFDTHSLRKTTGRLHLAPPPHFPTQVDSENLTFSLRYKMDWNDIDFPFKSIFIYCMI